MWIRALVLPLFFVLSYATVTAARAPIPEARAALDAWLMTHPPKAPHIIVTIARTADAPATVHLYDGRTSIGVLFGFGGPPDRPTLTGRHQIMNKLGTVHTNLYRRALGYEFYLPTFLQIKGNYGFHAYKVSDATRQVMPGPTHGCITLPPGDARALYHWAPIGTPIKIRYLTPNPDIRIE